MIDAQGGFDGLFKGRAREALKDARFSMQTRGATEKAVESALRSAVADALEEAAKLRVEKPKGYWIPSAYGDWQVEKAGDKGWSAATARKNKALVALAREIREARDGE